MSNKNRIALPSLALALAAGLVAAPPPPARGAEVEEEMTRSIAAPAGVHLDVSNSSGETVVESWDRAEVRVDAVKQARARTGSRARELLGKITVGVEEKGERIVVSARYPKRDVRGVSLLGALFAPGDAVWVDFIVRVPRASRVTASSTSGDVSVSNVGGPVNVDATSGDVTVAHVAGRVTVDATSGDVEVDQVSSDLELHLTSGSITLQDVAGRVSIGVTSGDVVGAKLSGGGEVSTISGDIALSETKGKFDVSSSSGDVSFQDHLGPLTVKTSSGDVEMSLRAPLAGPYRLDASSGSVRVVVPVGASCRLDLSTAGGALRARLPMEIQEVSRSRLRAIAGSGDVLLEITTASGSIEVSEHGAD